MRREQQWYKSHTIRKRAWGQSLVEFTMTLPVLLLIVAGVLEVGNVLTQYLKLNQVVRESARFGAAGGTDAGIQTIIENSAAGGLLSDADHMTAWVIRPVVDTGPPWAWESGTWVESCLFGDDCASIPVTAADALADLQAGSTDTDIDGTRIVLVVVRYEAETLLNLPFFQAPGQAGDRIPVSATTFMTQEVEQATVNMLSGGCSAYPIGLNVSITSDGGNSISAATEEELFSNLIQGTDFFYLDWRPGGLLVDSLNFPGNSVDATAGYLNPTDGGDTQMHRDDPVSVETSIGTITGALDSHITSGRTLRLIVYDVYDSVSGWVEIYGFAVFRIDSRNGTNDLTLEFVRWDTSCGFSS